MKRESEIPADLLAYLEHQKQMRQSRVMNTLDIFCAVPVRAAKMKMFKNKNKDTESFRMAIVPAVDVYTTNKAVLAKGFLKRDALSFFISGTRKVFPYGHIYAESGYVCLGNIFVPSAVPMESPTMPLETLFLHNDRNLSHGNSHLFIDGGQAYDISIVMEDSGIRLSKLAKTVIEEPGCDIIANDEIWSLSADVADQKPLPEALHIMSDVYGIVFGKEKPVGQEEEGKEE